MRCLLLKKPLLIIGLLLSVTMGYGQKHDNNWLWGLFIYNQDSALLHQGNAYASFNNDTLATYSKFLNMPFSKSVGFFSNADGVLELYSNGMQIRDTTTNLIQGGDSLNYGLVWNQFYSVLISGDLGYPTPRDLIFINEPDADSTILVIHELTGNSSNNYNNFLNFSKIQRKQNNVFSVVTKNSQLLQYPIAYRNFSGCKHGNGRDWWILCSEDNTNCITKILIKHDTIIVYGSQCIGDTIANAYGIKSTFSLDGSKYANTDAIKNGTNVFDFDRCTGELSNPKHVDAIVRYDTIFGAPVVADRVYNIELSPDGNLLYVMTGMEVLQFDLNSPQFPNDFDTVGVTDLWTDTALGFNHPFYFWSSTYGPDGVMYIGPGNSQRYLSTITQPNVKGDGCNFGLRSIELPKIWAYTTPNIPNYRLGRSIGSACDTVYSDVKPIYKETPWLKVYPNPANDNVRVDYNWVEWERILECRMQILDLKGSVMYEQAVPRYSTRQDVNVKELPQGVYTVVLTATPKSPKGDFNSPASTEASAGRQQPIAVCKLTVVR